MLCQKEPDCSTTELFLCIFSVKIIFKKYIRNTSTRDSMVPIIHWER